MPDAREMSQRIEFNTKESREKRTYSISAVTQIDFFPYMDELAAMIGCKPNFGSYMYLLTVNIKTSGSHYVNQYVSCFFVSRLMEIVVGTSEKKIYFSKLLFFP